MKSIFKITVFSFLMIFMSCDNEDLEEVNNEEETTEIICPDEDIISYLEVCEWYFTNTSLESSTIVDFSNMNIHAYDQNGDFADEGNWSIESGVISLNSLSATLANYIGDWTITECREDFIALSKGDEIIHLERGECEEEITCSDDEITTYLTEACTWAMTGGRTLGFTETTILVYDNNDAVYEEANWSIENGIITFENLIELQYYNGDWTITECGEDFIELTKGEDIIHLEKEACE